MSVGARALGVLLTAPPALWGPGTGRAPKGGALLPAREVDGSGARDNLAPMQWFPTLIVIGCLVLAFLTGRELRKGGR